MSEVKNKKLTCALVSADRALCKQQEQERRSSKEQQQGRDHSELFRWSQILALSSASALFVDCQASSTNPPSTWRGPSPAMPHLPWIATLSSGFPGAAIVTLLASIRLRLRPASCRASAQGLATAPLKALAWMCKTAGLPCCENHCSPPLCRAFSVASAPSEHRESLPRSLSLVVWLEQSVLDPPTSPAQVLPLGFLLVFCLGFPALRPLSVGSSSPGAVSNCCARSGRHLRPHQDNEARHALGSVGSGFLGLRLLLLVLAFSLVLAPDGLRHFGCATHQGFGLPVCSSRGY